MTRLLNWIAVVAVLDSFLLAPLLYASFTDNDDLIGILGPTHGIGFVILVAMCLRGATERFWGWWFPPLVVVTLGPPGSLIGDVLVRRRMAAAATATPSR